MKLTIYNGDYETVYTLDELQKINEASISYYGNQIKELRSELNKTKEELREGIKKEYEDEIQRLKDKLRFSIATLGSEKELKNYKDFTNKHSECRSKSQFSGGRMPIIIQIGTGFGTCTEVQCPICGEKKDITDSNAW